MADMIAGTLVMYRLTEDQAVSINRRRADAGRNRHEIVHGRHGYQAHVGNSVTPGQALPMLIVAAWPKTGDMQYVNGQVFLDGNDTLWVTSVRTGTELGQYSTAAEIDAAEKAAAAKAKAAQDAIDRAEAAEAAKVKAAQDAAERAAIADKATAERAAAVEQRAADKAEAAEKHGNARTRS